MSPRETESLVLQCGTCGNGALCGTSAMVQRLLTLGMLRRNANPDPAEVRELLRGVAHRLACDACGSTGLQVLAAPKDDLELETCESCGRTIPRERLELFPNARQCVSCQRLEETGKAPLEPDYCPRCGSPMAVRAAGGAGIHRYRLACTNPRCR